MQRIDTQFGELVGHVAVHISAVHEMIDLGFPLIFLRLISGAH
jgi:hypothetical protein